MPLTLRLKVGVNLDPSVAADRITIRLNTVYETLVSITLMTIIAGGAAGQLAVSRAKILLS